MKNLFEPECVEEVKARCATLRPDSEHQWGKMNPAQAMAHCTASLELAMGDRKPPRLLIGRLIGGVIKPKALGDDAPLRRNVPTIKELVMLDERNLNKERGQLLIIIDRFAAGGRAGCTSHPHSFFGRLAQEEWALLMCKHLDHHLRQFGA